MPKPGLKPKTRQKPKPTVSVEHEEKAETEAPGYRRWLKYILAALIALLLVLKFMEQEAETPEAGDSPYSTAVPVNRDSPLPATVPGVETSTPPQSSPYQGGDKGGGGPVPPVKNILPEVMSIKLNPKLVYPGTRIKAVIEGKDEDGDTVTFYREWKKNDELLVAEGTVPIYGQSRRIGAAPGVQGEDELDTKGLKKGDWITLYVIPFDGKEKGKRKWSPTIMISNRPPEITSSPPAALSNGRYIYEVKAADPDGDKLTFSLENAPPGMTIDPVKGRIEWKLPKADDPKSSGSFSIKVVVSDGNAIAFQGFSLTPKIEVVQP